MKSFNILAVAALIIAAAGILIDYNRTAGTTWLSYVSCIPLVLWVLFLFVSMARGK